jgi:hypothetical protein
MRARVGILVVFMALAGCSTNHVALKYQAAAALPNGRAIVQVGQFADARNVDPHWLGAVRSGWGTPLKTLVTDDAISEVVRNGFKAGLASRGLLLDAADAPVTLSAIVQKFDCSQYVRREAHAVIAVRLVETASGKALLNEVFERHLVIENPNIFDAAAFASANDLQVVAVRLLKEVIDTSLDSATIKQALAAAIAS